MLNKDLERVQMGLKPLKAEHVVCMSCGCKWFEQVEATRIDLNELGSLGQRPRNLDEFHLLKCLRCGDLQEPPIGFSAMSPLRTTYNDLLEDIQKPVEKKEVKAQE